MTNPIYEKLWSNMEAKFKDTVDKLGMDIDGKILDTVIALNLLGISTTQSCEGHLDHSLAGPWVILRVPDSQETDSLKKQAHQAYNEAEIIKTSSPTTFLNDSNYRILMDKYREYFHKSLIPTMNNALKIVPLLDKFYQNRQAPYLYRLTLSEEDTEVPRLRNQGIYFQDVANQNKKAKDLLEFQKEMSTFTEFLKHELKNTL